MIRTIKKIKKHVEKFIAQNRLLKRTIAYARIQAKKLSFEELLFIVAFLFSVFFIIGLYT